jgi:hypothetical protein
MLHLLDANVLITAHNRYYPIDSIPEFWSWLVHRGGSGDLKMPLENYEEVKEGGTDEEKDQLFSRVINEGYALDLTDDEVVQIGRDPFLIAYALAEPTKRCVVTTEVSAPSKLRQNRRIPNVCDTMGVNCCNTFAMMKALGFKTGWKS